MPGHIEKGTTYVEDGSPQEAHLSQNSGIWIETADHTSLEMAGSVVGWGQRWSADELKARIKETYPSGQEMDDPGFNTFYLTPEGLPHSAAVEDEHEAVQVAIHETLDILNWKPADIDAIFVGSGSPTVPNYARKVAELCGFSNITVAHNVYAACNSGADAFARSLELQGKKVVVAGIEGMTRLGSFDPAQVDNISRAVFSNGIAVWAGIPGESISLVPGMTTRFHQEDTDGHLAAVMTYRMPYGSFFVDDGEVTAVRLPEPPDGAKIKMNGRRTAIMFLRAVRERYPEYYRMYESMFGTGMLDFGIMHKASIKVWQGITEWLPTQQIPLRFIDAVRDGNASAANTMKAFVRLLPNMQENRHYPVISFGAGISGTLAVVQPGSLQK